MSLLHLHDIYPPPPTRPPAPPKNVCLFYLENWKFDLYDSAERGLVAWSCFFPRFLWVSGDNGLTYTIPSKVDACQVFHCRLAVLLINMLPWPHGLSPLQLVQAEPTQRLRWPTQSVTGETLLEEPQGRSLLRQQPESWFSCWLAGCGCSSMLLWFTIDQFAVELSQENVPLS